VTQKHTLYQTLTAHPANRRDRPRNQWSNVLDRETKNYLNVIINTRETHTSKEGNLLEKLWNYKHEDAFLTKPKVLIKALPNKKLGDLKNVF